MGYRNAKSGRENIFEETVDKGILHEDINYVVLEAYILLHRTPYLSGKRCFRLEYSQTHWTSPDAMTCC